MRSAVFDIEANALDARDVTIVWCIVIQDLQTEEIFKYGPDKIQEGVGKLSEYDTLIGHNVLGYDILVLQRLHQLVPKGRVIDTLVLSRLANPDRGMPWGFKGPRRPHSIEVWGHRLEKHKIEWDEWDQWDEGMLERCTQDVLINTAVYKALYNEFKE